MGNLMRQYWLPCCTTGSWSRTAPGAHPLLGEDLIAFRDSTG